MLSRKNFAAGIPAVSMDELAALADPFGPRARRADGNGHEARGAARFERPEARAPAGFYPGSPEGRPGPRGRREPPGADRWGPSPARRRPEDALLPRLVSRTPGAAGALEASLRAGPPEGASRGGSLETPGRRGARGAAFLGWAPPAALDAGPGDAAAADALPPYSEREPGRRPSLRSREPPVPGAADPRRRKDAARKAVSAGPGRAGRGAIDSGALAAFRRRVGLRVRAPRGGPGPRRAAPHSGSSRSARCVGRSPCPPG